jgi:hypothetical protein
MSVLTTRPTVTISIPAPTKAVLVLSKLDERYFQDISGNSCWTFDFVLFRKGSKEIVAESNAGRFWSRSVNQEVRLEKGEYVVHVSSRDLFFFLRRMLKMV